MLQFWKKSDRKHKGKQNCTNGTKNSPINNCSKINEQVGQLNVENGPYVPRSRLSKTLAEVLLDKDALGYFIQFMESKSALALIKFWLDVESFRSATGFTEDREEILLSPDDYSSINSELNTPVENLDDVFDTISETKSIKSYTHNSETILENDSQCTVQNGDKKLNRTSKHEDNISVNTDLDDTSYQMHDLENVSKNEHKEIFKKCHTKINGSVQSLYNNTKPEYDNDKTVENGLTENYNKIKRTYSVPQDFEEANLKRTISMTSLRKRKDFYTNIVFQDAVRISKKYICDNAPYFIKLPEHIKHEIINKIRANLINRELFTTGQDYVFTQIEQNYFDQFLRSDFHTKHQIDILTSGQVILEDILFNEMALFHFMEFIEQETDSTNRNFIEFFLAAVNFRENFISDNPEQMENDAVVLYDKYFSLQAMNPLNLGDEIRFHVEQNICREQGPIVSSFDLPLKITQNYLERDYLKPFLMSQLFFKYLNELIDSIHTKFKHKRTVSEDLNKSKAEALKKTNNNSKNKFDMSIEISNMTDPDSLWKRKRQNCGLKFGRVNELGRFQSDLEPDYRNTSSGLVSNWKLSKAVLRKFVSKRDVDTKEEIAWQVAEMIVKDITSLTLNTNVSGSTSTISNREETCSNVDS